MGIIQNLLCRTSGFIHVLTLCQPWLQHGVQRQTTEIKREFNITHDSTFGKKKVENACI
jgi:hypothetical protein